MNASFRKFSACQRVSVSAFLSATLLLAFVALSMSGCTASARKARHLSAARDYAAAGAYDKAEIEYMNVLQIDPQNADAIAGLGLMYFDEGRVTRVFAYLSKAQELQPNNLTVRDRLGTLYQGAGKFTEARTEALYVLEHQPDDAEAPLLLADAALKPAEIQDARTRLEHLPGNASRGAPVLTALGILDIKQRDLAKAQTDFEQARQTDPKFVAAHLGLASIYRAHQDPAKAEQEYSTAASLSPIRSGVRIQYAQFELVTGHADKAKQILDEVIQKAPDCLPAYLTRADIAMNEQKPDDALALVETVLKHDGSHPDALAQLGRILLAKGETTKAISALDHAVTVYPKSPVLTYLLGTAYASAGDFAKAAGTLNQTLQMAPTYAPATLALAEVEIRQGNFNAAIARLKTLVQQHPELAQAQLSLGNAYTRQGDLGAALATYRQLQKASPFNPQTVTLIGAVLALQGNTDEARAAFEHALELAPNFLPALQQLADLDIKAKDFAGARSRVQSFATKYPLLSAPHVILAQISLTQNDNANAKAELEKAIKLQPDQALPYMLLARVYLSGTDPDKAVANLEEAYKNNPKNPEPLMMIAVIRDEQKNYPAARDYYEKVLAINPRFSAALNNLAYLYSEHLNDQNRAFEDAQRARELLPGEPHAADTLGWILYKRGQYPWALSLLSESAEGLPTSEDVQFHLGMVQYRLGNEAGARASLTKALSLNPNLSGAADAKKALAVLSLDASKASQAEIAGLEQTAGDDPVALTRVGTWYAQHGDPTKAADAYERALKASPNNIEAALQLIAVYRAENQTAKALDLAKATRRLAPSDPTLAQTLGELALSSGDVSWSFSLLQEAVRNKPDDPAAWFAYGKAAYATGKTAAAREALEKTLALSPGVARATEAREWVEMIDLAQDGSKAVAGLPRIQQILAARPDDPAALVALAAAKAQQKDLPSATDACNRVLGREPDFAPANRQLAFVLADQPANSDAAPDVASKARDAYPNDPQVARAAGIITYRQGNYQRAAALLKEASRTLSSDATVWYYLGVTQRQLKDFTHATESLKRALAAGLNTELAAEARRLLAAK